MAVILLLGWGGMTSLGGSSMALPCLCYMPITVFFVVFIFGQRLFGGRGSPSLWLDKLCVHQTDLDMKMDQIAALPVFVANSANMLVVWDETYFDRLWCNLELATFARYGGTAKVTVLPTWLAPWLLCSIFLDLVSATIFEILERVFPGWTVALVNPVTEVTESLLGPNPALLNFVVWFIMWFMTGVAYLPSSLPCLFSFRMKLQHHQRMLDRMAEFDLRAAECTEPSDREAVEEQAMEQIRVSI